jgi:hypothetical protein
MKTHTYGRMKDGSFDILGTLQVFQSDGLEITNTFKLKREIEDPIHNELFCYLLEKYGKNSVKYIEAYYQIEVKLPNVFYNISLSGNETKFYFSSIPQNLIQDVDYQIYIQVKSFKVFTLELAKKYIEFKEQENDFIKSIEG